LVSFIFEGDNCGWVDKKLNKDVVPLLPGPIRKNLDCPKILDAE
jgi:hypothetical protein